MVSDLRLASRARVLITESVGGLDDFVTYAEDSESAVKMMESYSYLDLCVCDLDLFHSRSFMGNLLQRRFPRTRIILLTMQDLSDNESIEFTGKTVLCLPKEEALFRNLCDETLYSMQPSSISHFNVGPRLKASSWCDWYDAFDTVLKREIYITRIHPWASRDEELRFRATTNLMARARHDFVRSVYMAGEFEGSSYACLEKLDLPHLGELLQRREHIDTQTAVRIVSTTIAVLRFWDEHKYPHSTLNKTDVFVSKHFVKLENCVDPSLGFEPSKAYDLRFVGEAIRILLPIDQMPRQLQVVLNSVPAGPRVCFKTSLGEILVELDDRIAPFTVANFLKYVRRNSYDDTLFHHVIDGFIAQGGCLTRNQVRILTDSPIINEASDQCRNKRGTLTMARHKLDPDSATSQFIFNLVDNPQLDSTPEEDGYAVFGKVVQGMEVLDQIARVTVAAKGPHFCPVHPLIIYKVQEIVTSLEEVIDGIQALENHFCSIGKLREEVQSRDNNRQPTDLSFSSSLKTLSTSLKKISKVLNG